MGPTHRVAHLPKRSALPGGEAERCRTDQRCGHHEAWMCGASHSPHNQRPCRCGCGGVTPRSSRRRRSVFSKTSSRQSMRQRNQHHVNDAGRRGPPLGRDTATPPIGNVSQDNIVLSPPTPGEPRKRPSQVFDVAAIRESEAAEMNRRKAADSLHAMLKRRARAMEE